MPGLPTAKVFSSQPTDLLQPLSQPLQVWQEISTDFVEALPRTEGFDSVLLVVDIFSKY